MSTATARMHGRRPELRHLVVKKLSNADQKKTQRADHVIIDWGRREGGIEPEAINPTKARVERRKVGKQGRETYL